MVRSQPFEVAFEPEQLWIAGDTPVALALARLAESVGFCVSTFAQPEDVLSERIFNTLSRSSVSAVVLFGSMEDRLAALNHWINFPLVFLGARGTRAERVDLISSLHLLQPAAPRDQIERIHCPLGLSIGASGSEEAAISIVAQLIQNRSDRRISHEAASRIRSPSLIKARAA